jgi:hypothetical protein
MNLWGQEAMEHWQLHRPASLAALTDPIRYFEQLGEEASERYISLRDGFLAGTNPNGGTTTWDRFPDQVAQADQTAREIVEREMIFLPPTPEDEAATD